MSNNETRPSYQRGLIPWKKGQSGNPKGRPKGSKHKITEEFLRDFYDAWQAFGRPALMAMAWSEPGNFVKVAAGMVPKEIEATVRTIEARELSDNDLAHIALGGGEGADEAEEHPQVLN